MRRFPPPSELGPVENRKLPGNTRASVLSANNELVLAPTDGGGTEVKYASEVSVTGRLGKFGLGIMKKKADALGAKFAENFRGKIEATAK